MNIAQVNKLPINDFLEREGIYPKQVVGRNWWYLSPIRLQERTASFKVDTSINRWYDHGIGEGGKLFDLAMRLFSPADAETVIEAVSSRHSLPSTVSLTSNILIKDEKIEIQGARPLGFHKALIYYLNSRGIQSEIAAPYCKDVTFKIKGKEYFALGLENRSGGFELRNSFFKGSSSPKDVKLIENNSDSINVLEGFMDYLSLLTLKLLPSNQDYLILNSLSFIKRSLPIIQNYKTVNLLLNNDASGVKATKSLLETGIPGNDQSNLYRCHKDINDFLTASMNSIKAPYKGIRFR